MENTHKCDTSLQVWDMVKGVLLRHLHTDLSMWVVQVISGAVVGAGAGATVGAVVGAGAGVAVGVRAASPCSRCEATCLPPA